jgi:hypothetical protein
VRGVSGDTGTGLELPAQQTRAAVRAANKAPTKNGTASEFTVADPHFTPFVADDDPAPASPRLYCLLLLVLYPSTVPERSEALLLLPLPIPSHQPERKVAAADTQETPHFQAAQTPARLALLFKRNLPQS